MGNNNEIRKRLEIFHKVLLVIVWIIAVSGVIGGVKMIDDSFLRIFGIIMIIVSIFEGFLGHFLVNVVLSIPFILLNNGDYLAAIVPEGKIVKSAISSVVSNQSVGFSNPFKVIESVSIREKPELTSSYVFNLNYNEIISVIEVGEKISDTNYWIHVKNKDGKDGWCYSEKLEEMG